MTDARPWLPDGCLTSGRSVVAIADVVALWSSHWFTTSPLTLNDQWVRHCGQTAGEAGWMQMNQIAPGLVMQSQMDADMVVGQKLLCLAQQRTLSRNADQQLIRTAGRAVLSDLAGRVSNLRPQSQDAPHALEAGNSNKLFAMTLNDNAGKPVTRIVAAFGFLVDLVKRSVAQQRTMSTAASKREVITTTRVEYAARIGTARLAYADLVGLAKGDVLILDSDRTLHFDLLVNGKIAAPRSIIPEVANDGRQSSTKQGYSRQ